MIRKLVFLHFLLAGICDSCADAPREVRILSYNVHACSPEGSTVADYDAIAEYIKESGADIVALQELDCRNKRHAEDQIRELASRCGMKGHFTKSIRFRGGEYGIGMLFRERPLTIDELKLPGKEPRSLLSMEFDEAIYIVTHLCLLEENQVASMEIIGDYADSIAVKGKPIFIAGDFNVEIDSCAFVDLFHRDWIVVSGPELTFPSDAPRSRIDYVMLHRDPTADEVEIVRNGIYRSSHRNVAELSDHLPIFVDLAW